MSDSAFPEPDVAVDATTPEELKAQLDDGDAVTVLDVRATNEFETWHIDGESATVVNVPYFDLLDGIPADLLDRLPDGQPVVVVCAKGGSSEFIAGLLNEEGVEATNLENGMKGWARIYEYAELDVESEATVAQYRRPSSGCLAYLVVSDGEAAVIDPLRAFADEYVQDARALGTELTYALDTHVHADHISGVRDVAAETGAEIVLPEAAVDRGVEYDVDYRTVADGDTLTVGTVDIDVIHTPGHTSGMTSYLIDDEVLLTGDGLFTESVARPDLEDGDDGAPDAAGTLYDTLQEKVLTLPDETLIAPAHFSGAATPRDDGTYAAAVGDLTARMPALEMDRAEFVEFVLSDMPPRPSNYEEIIATNLGQADATDEEAFELELGPNNCAASSEALTD
ncbi:Glyoxylase, beta-lactamase superfamily II [Halogranum gelatinilyticum]|uniref:Glyoxylase, beta-lactamase superfamily II n=1 Tax=Halogranum gelatinilyticum TaxID=660521 RepID=A0A1G9U3R8_9EURY|nr:MBL fold metallo-hydrolase [Halogranum gelatinilyticum]SDM54531.1 Glyoxylase, beta-lactamase superfamily II [Halogranum gelatinilyticum]